MRRHDPQSQEDGFQLLLPHAADHGLRCWLLGTKPARDHLWRARADGLIG
ncbi:hypothetical protein [Jiangella alba]|uniref:Uncharacterized protein n=1 Tax=Jiangella alba TaxID=561176 RepID=A0A1H5P9L3_9ACTN|nr:hypothetical protein [Jiangella alba]SEF10603.1 hypothetical protein SAMN04488561_3960 [Jiangella alba]